MDRITKNLVAAIIVEFYNKEKRISQESIAETLGVDHSSVSNWLNKRNSISTANFNKLLEYLDNDKKIIKKTEFTTFVIDRLNCEGFDESKHRPILQKQGYLSDLINELISTYSIIDCPLQNKLNISLIISRVISLCRIYQDYIWINDQQRGFNSIHNSWIYCHCDKEGSSLVTQQNHLIFNFPDSYRVAVLLSNYSIGDVIGFGDFLQKLKETNNIDMIIVYTDNEISFSKQKYYMETYNLFYETIAVHDLQKARIQNVEMGIGKNAPEEIEAHFYAQVVFERLTSYFTVIRNEIIFRAYKQKESSSIINLLNDSKDLFRGIVDKVLLKNVFKYSYLSRHSIYFERARLQEKVLEIMKNNNKDKLGTAIELCFPNAFLSSSIYEYFNDLLLFTSSYHALDVMKKIKEEKTKEGDNKPFPPNVQFMMSHIQPQYISNQYGEKIMGKTDLVILGFGMGSSLANLTEYLRHINSWLSPEGILMISFANADSVILHKQFGLQNHLEITPLFFSDYWQYTATETLKFLARIKRYSVDKVKKIISNYVDEFECYTYPFLSSFVNISTDENWLLDEIRSIDKEYACQKNTRHGHYITIIGNKNSKKNISEIPLEERCGRISKIIKDFIDGLNIEYKIINHSVTIDTNNLQKALLEEGEDINQFDLVKTVILKSSAHESDKKDIIYVITPRDFTMDINRNQFNLLDEKTITNLFGIGSVSPLVVLPEVMDYTKYDGRFSLCGMDALTKEYVIISSGISTSSIKLKRVQFLELMKALENISEV